MRSVTRLIYETLLPDRMGKHLPLYPTGKSLTKPDEPITIILPGERSGSGKTILYKGEARSRSNLSSRKQETELPTSGQPLLIHLVGGPSGKEQQQEKGWWASLSKKKKAAVIAAPVAAIGGGYAALRAYKKRKEREEESSSTK